MFHLIKVLYLKCFFFFGYFFFHEEISVESEVPQGQSTTLSFIKYYLRHNLLFKHIITNRRL